MRLHCRRRPCCGWCRRRRTTITGKRKGQRRRTRHVRRVVHRGGTVPLPRPRPPENATVIAGKSTIAAIIRDLGRRCHSKIIDRATARPIWSCGCFTLLLQS
nr:uncharacterized protein LOC112715007 [Arachis hypogaea]